MQDYHISAIPLRLCDTSRIKIGIGHAQSSSEVKEEITYYAHLIFGICMTVHCVEAMLTRCHMVPICAPYLEDLRQQEALISLLKSIERENVWPTNRIVLGAISEWKRVRNGY